MFVSDQQTNVAHNSEVETFKQICKTFSSGQEICSARMSQSQSSLPQNKEAQLRSYQVHLKDNIRSMFENFTEIIKLARVSDKV